LLKLWFAKRYGTITRRDGKWHRYRYRLFHGKLPDEFDEMHGLKHVLFDFHMVYSSRSLIKVLRWENPPEQIRVQGDVRFWIENSKSCIYAPDLHYRDYIKERSCDSVLAIGIVAECMENYEYWCNHMPDVAMVGFSDNKEQVLFKLKFG